MSCSVAKTFKEKKFLKQAVKMVKFVFYILYCGTIKKKKHLFAAIPDAHADPSMHPTEQPLGLEPPPTAWPCPWPASRGPGNPQLPAWGRCPFSPCLNLCLHPLTSSAQPSALLWPMLVIELCSPYPKKNKPRINLTLPQEG